MPTTRPDNTAARAVIGILIVQLHKWIDLADDAYTQTPDSYRKTQGNTWKLQHDVYLHFMPKAMKVFKALGVEELPRRKKPFETQAARHGTIG